MATDLHDRATTQLSRFEQLTAAVRARLGSVRTERDRRHADPSTVNPPDWPSAFGASQHLQVARAALAENRSRQAAVRSALSGIDTPADAGAEGAELAALLVEESALIVSEREAAERVEVADSLIDDLGALLANAESLEEAAATRTDWAEARQQSIDRLEAALALAPLSTVVADATGVLGGAALTAADDRLDALLPAELRTRGEDRIAEARAVVATALGHVAAAEAEIAARDLAARPVDEAVVAAERALARSEAALERYVARSAGRVAAATSLLETVSGHPDLSASQVAALVAGDRPDAVTAVGEESDLATAVADVATARRAVEDAILDALSADPDADPEADAGVVAARDVLNAAALQDALSDARAAYDDSSRAALDAWEVEVPPSLWEALVTFTAVRDDLQTFSDQAARDALVTALGDATDALAQALDARDVAWRGDVQCAWQLAERAAVERAAAGSAAARLRAYSRGDGPSGRTTAEL